MKLLRIFFFFIVFVESQLVPQQFHRFFSTKTTYSQAREYISKNSKNELQSTIPHHCKPKMFNLVARHAIRYPNIRKMTEMKDKMYIFKESIINNKNLSPSVIEKYSKWQLKMDLKDENRISDTGFEETKNFAKRLKNEYPDFFDEKKSNINFFVTSKNRTYETALGFIEGIGFNKNFTFIPKKHLVFHQTCQKKLTENGVIFKGTKELKELKRSSAFINLRKKFANFIGIEFEKFTFKDLKAIYTTCMFEMALYREDTWCNLFSNEDLVLFEYLNDMQSYSKGGYGRKINSEMACPILVDLFENINSVKNVSNTKTILQFSHSGIFKRIYSMLGLFKNFGSSLCRGSNHCKQEWRSSLILPFLTNINFILYDCSTNSVETDYKILTKVQEQPVKVSGCDEVLCSLKQFVKKYKESADNCNLNEICKI